MKQVTNIPAELFLHPSALTALTIFTGSSSDAEARLNMECIIAITMAAGIPFPLTSPTTKKSFPSLMKKSKMSPPTSLAGLRDPNMSTSVRSGKGGNFLGSISSWIRLAIWSSLPILAWST